MVKHDFGGGRGGWAERLSFWNTSEGQYAAWIPLKECMFVYAFVCCSVKTDFAMDSYVT
jgi:hypothetical protein